MYTINPNTQISISLPTPNILAFRTNNTNRHNQTLIVLILLTAILVAGIYTIDVPTVLADSRILKQDTKQNANCATVGAGSPVSDSCNQKTTNNVNNGVLRTTGTSETTGTLLVTEFCNFSSQQPCPGTVFFWDITGDNPQPPSFSLSNGESQLITLGPGSFVITLAGIFNFPGLQGNPIVTGDCLLQTDGITGTITAGQHLTCTIRFLAS